MGFLGLDWYYLECLVCHHLVLVGSDRSNLVATGMVGYLLVLMWRCLCASVFVYGWLALDGRGWCVLAMAGHCWVWLTVSGVG